MIRGKSIILSHLGSEDLERVPTLRNDLLFQAE